jgi:glycosyltransferase involved in cell wall biosynthesis
LAVLEAMAAGLPVVASAVDGVPEQVDETSAILVGPDDVDAVVRAVERLLDDASLRASMGRRGVERIATCFAPERQAAELASAYEKALGSRERRRPGRGA